MNRLALALAAMAAVQAPQFRSGAERIVIDVQVVDPEGRPIDALGPADFEVRIGRQVRPVLSAEFIHAADLTTAAGGAAAATNTFSSARDGNSGGRDFILAIDEASFRTADAPAVVAAAGGFVRHLAPNDRVGLFTFPASPRYFALTPDHAAVLGELRRVIGSFSLPRSQFHLSPSEVIDIEAGDSDLVKAIARRECLPQPIYQAECTQAIPGDANLIAQAIESLNAMSTTALRVLFKALDQAPGRKTVVVVSGGLFAADRVGGRPDVTPIIDRLATDAARVQANLYVLHADGSFLNAFSAANGGGVVTRSLMRESAAAASGLERLAGTVGGALIRVESGQEDRAFQQILRETSAYYLLAVEPLDEDRDGRMHYITVKTSARGAEVRARRTVIIPRVQLPTPILTR